MERCQRAGQSRFAFLAYRTSRSRTIIKPEILTSGAMTTVDLREKPVTVDELLQLASAEAVVIVSQDVNEFVVEPADAFDREASQLGAEHKVPVLSRGAVSGRRQFVATEDMERRLNP